MLYWSSMCWYWFLLFPHFNFFASIFQCCEVYVQVSVPCSILSTVVTVRCGHCTSLLSVNMKKASFVPFHLLASLTHLEVFWLPFQFYVFSLSLVVLVGEFIDPHFKLKYVLLIHEKKNITVFSFSFYKNFNILHLYI